jgi:hypothetical protein
MDFSRVGRDRQRFFSFEGRSSVVEKVNQHMLRFSEGSLSAQGSPQLFSNAQPRVRQLKELGLTESLEVGYRLSPRGRAVLECLVSDRQTQAQQLNSWLPMPS